MPEKKKEQKPITENNEVAIKYFSLNKLKTPKKPKKI